MKPRAVGLLLLIAAACCVAAPSDAKVRKFGSSLKAKATWDRAYGSDTVYWARKSSRGSRAPASGQVLAVKIKGKALSDRTPNDPRRGGETMFHVQTLHRLAHGQWRVMLTSQAFFMPNQNAPDQKITTFRPVNLCVTKGEAVGFNTVGGFWPEGYPAGTGMKIFAKRKRSKYRWFTGGGQTNNGAVFGSQTQSRRELLMQIKLGTGKDAGGVCRRRARGARVFRRSGLPVPPA